MGKKSKDELTELTKGERHLLETGDSWPRKGSWSDYGESWVRPFHLVSRVGISELRELWGKHREALLEQWKKDGKRGLPWAAKEFDQ